MGSTFHLMKLVAIADRREPVPSLMMCKEFAIADDV
jgi:hypothetical protein